MKTRTRRTLDPEHGRAAEARWLLVSEADMERIRAGMQTALGARHKPLTDEDARTVQIGSMACSAALAEGAAPLEVLVRRKLPGFGR